MRRLLWISLLAACGSDQALETDLEPIALARAPLEPGGPSTGALYGKVTTPAGIEPMLIDTAFPLTSLGRAGCAGGPSAGWTYTGDFELRDGTAVAAVRARFHSVGLFDICSGTIGDTSLQPAGVLGGPLLGNFAVGLTLPRTPSDTNPTLMSLWPGYPGTDDQLAQDGLVALRYDPRGSAAFGQASGEASLTLPNARIVLATCVAPRPFAPTEPVEVCAHGQAALKASGVDLMLAVGTGAGPLVLSDTAWREIALQLGVAPDGGTPGLLYSPFSATPIAARYVDVPRLAILQGNTDTAWLGACTELARSRRIEWVMANQLTLASACFQPCDADGGKALTSKAYLELGGTLRAAIVAETSDVIRSLNSDAPPHPQIDGLIGAATLAGTRLHLDYVAKPSGRVVAECEPGSVRENCWAAPSCPPLGANGQEHRCFGQPDKRGFVPVCKP